MSKRLNLWILNHHAIAPDIPGGGLRHFAIGRELRKLGVDVTIIASSFNHTLKRETRLAEGETWKVETIEGVRFCWLRTTPYRRNNGRRVLGMLGYQMLATRLGKKLPGMEVGIPRPDVVLGSSVHLLAVQAARRLAKHYRARFLMEVRDLWPQTLIDMGALTERSALTWLLRRLEISLYRAAEQIITLLPQAADYIAPLGIEVGKIAWIPNGVDLSLFASASVKEGGGEGLTVMYMGAHGEKNALGVLLEAARQLQTEGEEGIRFVLVGDGPLKADLMRQAAEWGLENLRFEPIVPRQAVPGWLSRADVLCQPAGGFATDRYGISPNKLFEYMAAGKPVISRRGVGQDVVEISGCGFSIPPADPAALVDVLRQLKQMTPEARSRMGARGQDYVKENHGFASLALRLHQLLIHPPKPE